jgi:hypothetical protein
MGLRPLAAWPAIRLVSCLLLLAHEAVAQPRRLPWRRSTAEGQSPLVALLPPEDTLPRPAAAVQPANEPAEAKWQQSNPVAEGAAQLQQTIPADGCSLLSELRATANATFFVQAVGAAGLSR